MKEEERKLPDHTCFRECAERNHRPWNRKTEVKIIRYVRKKEHE